MFKKIAGLMLLLGCSSLFGQLAGNGPIASSVMSYDYYVGVGNNTTIAATAASVCAGNPYKSSIVSGTLIIPMGSTPADSVSSIGTSGCAGLIVWDRRVIPNLWYTCTTSGCTQVAATSTAVANSLTFNNGGSGATSGSTFNGSSAVTVSYNTIGASPTAGSTSLTTLGTITSGTWNGSIIGTTYGGTGITTASSTGLPQISSGTWSVYNTACTGAAYALTYSSGAIGCNSAIQAASLLGNTWAAPGTIGSTTPSTGAFTTLSATGKLTTAASTTTTAGINIPHGSAPTTPVNGDCWTTTGGLYCYINGATVGPYSSSGTGTLNSSTAYYLPYYSSASAISGASVTGMVYSTGSAAPTAATAHNESTPANCIAASASGTAYTCTTSPSFTPATGDHIQFMADVANTGSATLSVNGATAATIKKWGRSGNLIANDLLASHWISATYDGTYWQLEGQLGNTGLSGSTAYSIPYQSAAATTGFLAPNTTTTKEFMAMTGTGAAGAAPVWATIASTDLTTALTTPPAIGGTTPSTGAFTTITASSTASITGNLTTTTISPAAGATYAIGSGNSPYLSIYANSVMSGTSTALSLNATATAGYLQVAGTTYFDWTSSALYPATTAAYTLGLSANVWSTTYSNAIASAASTALTLNATATAGYLQVAATTYYGWTSSALYPATTAARTLGTSSLVWSTTYSNAIASAASTALTLNATATAGYLQVAGTTYYGWTSSALYPNTTNTYSLGTSSYYWSNLYTTLATVATSVTVGGTTAGAATAQITTAATASNNYSGANLNFAGTVYSGSASVADTWAFTHTIGTGTYGTSTLALTHAGSTGTSTFSIGTAVSATGTITSSAGLIATSTDTGGANIRMTVGTTTGYGSFFRNDGTATYLLLTANNDPLGSFGALRPFYVTNSTGAVTLDGTGAGITAGGAITASGGITASSFSGAGTGLTGTASSLNIGGYNTATNNGYTGTGVIKTFSATTDWSSLPVGYQQMIQAGTSGTPDGVYGYFLMLGHRDGGGGWGGIWTDYLNGDTYVGNTSASTSYATWYKLLSSTNYNSYAPTLTGTGASGTWGISISGTAAQSTAVYASSSTPTTMYLTGVTGGNSYTTLYDNGSLYYQQASATLFVSSNGTSSGSTGTLQLGDATISKTYGSVFAISAATNIAGALSVGGSITATSINPSVSNTYAIGTASSGYTALYSSAIYSPNAATNLALGTCVSGSCAVNAWLFSTGDLSLGTASDSGYKLYVNGTSDLVGAVTVAGAVSPSMTNTYALGTASLVWSNTYTNLVTSGSASTLLLNASYNNGALQIGGTSYYVWDSSEFMPNVTNIYTLGNSDHVWSSLWATAANVTTVTATGAISGATVSGSTVSAGSLAVTTSFKQHHPISFADMGTTAYTASQVVVRYISPIAQTVATGQSASNTAWTLNAATCTSKAFLNTAATASTTFTIADATTSTTIGTIVFAASGTTGTISLTATSVAVGDKLTITAPSTADSTAAGLVASICSSY